MKAEKMVTVYLTEKEYNQIKVDADNKHMTMTGYIRFLITANAGKSIGQILGNNASVKDGVLKIGE